MKKWILVLILLSIFSWLFFNATVQTPVQIQNESEILDYINTHLPHTGQLMEHQDGYIFLKVDDNYIRNLFPLLNETAYYPPPYFRQPYSPGAHISVIYTGERSRSHPKKIAEIGNTYSFSPLSIAYVPDRSKEYIVIQVASPELEKLREKYGLSSLLKRHAFHITIAKKKRG